MKHVSPQFLEVQKTRWDKRKEIHTKACHEKFAGNPYKNLETKKKDTIQIEKQ